VAARVFCGLCMAPMEALVPASISDIWYVSEIPPGTTCTNTGVKVCSREGLSDRCIQSRSTWGNQFSSSNR
jgi:hypothetical protein